MLNFRLPVLQRRHSFSQRQPGILPKPNPGIRLTSSMASTSLRDGAHRAIWSQPTSSARAPTYCLLPLSRSLRNFNPDRLAHFLLDPHRKCPNYGSAIESSGAAVGRCRLLINRVDLPKQTGERCADRTIQFGRIGREPWEKFDFIDRKFLGTTLS